MRHRLTVRFDNKVSDTDKERWAAAGGIEQAMRGELAGVLNWVLSMSDNEFRLAVSSINPGQTYGDLSHLVNTNKIAAWLDDCAVLIDGAITYIGSSSRSSVFNLNPDRLYQSYESWCCGAGINPVALQRFSSNLLDVSEHLKLGLKLLPKTNKGRSSRGLLFGQTSTI